MANPYFRFKQFTVFQDKCAMKVSTDACIFGAWMAGIFAEQVSGEGRILDIGAGTGLLGLMIAQRCDAFITGVELQEESALQAASNMVSSPWSDRLRVVPGDINDLVFTEPFDAIITNPPFFENDLLSEEHGRSLARHGETLTHSQVLRVFFLDLTAHGIAGILLPYHRMESFLEEASILGFRCREQVLLRQTPDHDFFRAMLLMEREILEEAYAPPLVKEWAIREGEQYGSECLSLLKDYYLYL
jgi:tRNA1Val (adenine37-N6)-methyltransferase